MDALIIEGTPVPVRIEPEVEAVELTNGLAAFSGRWVSARPGTLSRARVLPVEVAVGRMTIAQLRALMAVLDDPDPVDVGGYLLAPGGGTVACHRDEISIAWGPNGDMAALSFRLHEVDADA